MATSSAAEALSRLGVAHAVAAWAKRQECAARDEAEGALLEAHEALGANSAGIAVCGVKVGTLSVRTSSDAVVVADDAAWQDHLRDLYAAGDPRVRMEVRYDAPDIQRGAAVADGVPVDADTGEVLPGLAWRPGGAVAGTTLRGCSEEAVAKALQAGGMDLPAAVRELSDGAAGLPGGGA